MHSLVVHASGMVALAWQHPSDLKRTLLFESDMAVAWTIIDRQCGSNLESLLHTAIPHMERVSCQLHEVQRLCMGHNAYGAT